MIEIGILHAMPYRGGFVRGFEPIFQAATNADVCQFLPGTPSSGEYFLIENRQKTGYDAGLPGSGLLIWHIDASKSGNTQDATPETTYRALRPHTTKSPWFRRILCSTWRKATIGVTLATRGPNQRGKPP